MVVGLKPIDAIPEIGKGVAFFPHQIGSGIADRLITVVDKLRDVGFLFRFVFLDFLPIVIADPLVDIESSGRVFLVSSSGTFFSPEGSFTSSSDTMVLLFADQI